MEQKRKMTRGNAISRLRSIRARNNRNHDSFNRRVQTQIDQSLARVRRLIDRNNLKGEKAFFVKFVEFKQPPMRDTERFWYLVGAHVAGRLPAFDRRCKEAVIHLRRDDNGRIQIIELCVYLQ